MHPIGNIIWWFDDLVVVESSPDGRRPSQCTNGLGHGSADSVVQRTRSTAMNKTSCAAEYSLEYTADKARVVSVANEDMCALSSTSAWAVPGAEPLRVVVAQLGEDRLESSAGAWRAVGVASS